MTADRASSDPGGLLDLARALCEAADLVTTAAADRRRLADQARQDGFSGPAADDLAARTAREEQSAAELASMLRAEAGQWAQIWADESGAPGRPTPLPPDYRPLPTPDWSWR